MRTRRASFKSSQGEPTITLINVVFLMLVFFLVAGTLAQPLDPDLTLVSTKDLEGHEPPNALVIHADGHLSYRAKAVTIADYLADQNFTENHAARILPDRDAPATKLLEVAATLRENGAKNVLIVTERTRQ